MPRKSVPACESRKNVFAERLTKAMKERGENQTTLADKITAQYVTIQRQTISLYMNGQSKPDTERLTAIAKTLDVSADWLLGLSDAKSKDSDIQKIYRQTGLSEDIIKYLQLSMKDGLLHILPSINSFNIFFRESGKDLFDFIDDLAWYRECAESAQATGNEIKQFLEGFGEGNSPPLGVLDEFIEQLEPIMKEIRYRRFVCIDRLTKRFDMAFKCDAIETLLQETFHSISDTIVKEEWIYSSIGEGEGEVEAEDE